MKDNSNTQRHFVQLAHRRGIAQYLGFRRGESSPASIPNMPRVGVKTLTVTHM